ncbi:hypothetical protein IT575_12125 [bacterium]|nr:hypothetical protein [bacterium]
MHERIERARRALLGFSDPVLRLELCRAFHSELDRQLKVQGEEDGAPPLEFLFPPDELLTPDAGNTSQADETEAGEKPTPPAPGAPSPSSGLTGSAGDATGRTPTGSAGGSGGRPPSKGRSGINPVRPDTALRLGHNDLGNALRFLRRHGEDVLYCEALGGWHVWRSPAPGGGYFRRDENGEAKYLMSIVLHGVEEEKRRYEPGTPEHDSTLHWAQHCRNQRPWNEALEAAKVQPMIARLPAEIDSHPHLFNVANGTLDLRPAEQRDREGLPLFRLASRADCLTKCSPVAWDEEARCPQWLQFLDTIMAGDQEMVDFLQRLAGYLLVAGNPEQKLVILHGSGGNGKSVFVETLMHVFGDYSTTTSTETLMDSERASNNQVYALAKLAGVRLLLASESKEGRRLDEALVKGMTGDSQIQARHPHGGFFLFQVEFMPWLMTNHRPEVRGQDEGIWRRLLMVPFNVRIPDEQRDTQLAEKLRAEAPGILAWAVRGLAEYQYILDEKGGSGLAPPAPVLAATAGYREDQDILGPFIAECCDLVDPSAPEYWTTSGDLLRRYQAWCEEEGARPLAPKPFAEQLRQKGVVKARDGRKRFWRGITVRPWDESEARPRSGHLYDDRSGGGG